MAISREDAISDIAKLLHPSTLSDGELRAKVEESVNEAERDPELIWSLREASDHEISIYDLRRAADEYIKAMGSALEAYKGLPPMYRASIELTYLDLTDASPDFEFLLRATIHTVEKVRDKFPAAERRRRSGGATEERAAKQQKIRCARIACLLFDKFHNDNKLSPEYRPYILVTARLFELWTGQEEQDVRRACREAYQSWVTYKQRFT